MILSKRKCQQFLFLLTGVISPAVFSFINQPGNNSSSLTSSNNVQSNFSQTLQINTQKPLSPFAAKEQEIGGTERRTGVYTPDTKTAQLSSVGFQKKAYKDPFVTIAKAVWGKPTSSRLIFLPFGYHVIQNPWGENNNQWLVDITFRGIAAGTFINSCKSRVYYGGVERDIYSVQQVTFHYVLGIMHGYRGKCGIAEALGPVIGHDPGPIIGLGASWSPAKHVSLDLVSYGVGVLGGFSYIF
ncbi:hypothetical protein [Legionella fallonii]|uniref:hypothetical protein n=1 Tax=Legionella fallonii TaxID=96230 RepID=UPI0005D31C18|nr:hypothetical protein [Legionella fallonii]